MHNRFKNKADALFFLSNIDWMSSHTNGKKFSTNRTYQLSHGEYSSPDYYPVRYLDVWAIKVEYFYYPGTFTNSKTGRIDEETFTNLFLIDLSDS